MERSYGGYTMDIDKCERYTRNELEKWRGNLKEEYPFFDELKAKSAFYRQDEILIRIWELEYMLGYRKYTVLTR